MAAVTLDISDPTARAHARLSASQTKRWMACPGSSILIDELPSEFKRSSGHAQRGTAAHTLVEMCLRDRLPDSGQYLNYWINQAGEIQRAAPLGPDGTTSLSDGEDGWYIVDHDMSSAVDVMISTVYAELERLGPQAEMHLERRFDLSWLRPDMFGTSDVTLSLFLSELVVIDYKHGQGVPVEVRVYDEAKKRYKPNPQLAYYALGVAEADAFTHETVKLVVVQPRCPHEEGAVRTITMTMAELLEFRDELGSAADRVREAEDAYRGLADEVDFIDWSAKYLHAGDHCKDAFCPRLATCTAAYQMAMDITQQDFAQEPVPIDAPTPEGDMERLGNVLKWAKFLDGLVKAAKAYGLRAKLMGMDVPGQKLVLGRSTRYLKVSEQELLERLADLDIPKSDFYSPAELKSPAQLEKLGKEVKKRLAGVPNPAFADDPSQPEWLFPPLVDKREGKVSLAPADDPRAEVAPDAVEDFADAYDDEGGED